MKENMPSLGDARWHMKALPVNGLKMVDLFCGAGIGAVGFTLAGFEIVQAIDNQPYAVQMYNQNFNHQAIVGDIRQTYASQFPYADVYTGGFPCKPFSIIGKGEGVEDEKNGDLGYHFYRLVKEGMPKAFLFENVGGLVSKKHVSFFHQLMKWFEEAGYEVSYPEKENGEPTYLNCWEHGVPQLRKRIFAVGIRKDLGKKFVFPEPIPLEQRTTIRDAIGDLPEPNEVNNHYGFGIRNDEKPYVDKIPTGGNWRDLPIEDQEAFLGKAFYSGGGRTGFLRKVSFDAPAYTLTSMMNGKNNAQILDNTDKYQTSTLDPLIPLSRRFTVRECLRLQTVPDWFSFPDSISIVKQYERCSGIPSLMAYQLGIALAETLRNESASITH